MKKKKKIVFSSIRLPRFVEILISFLFLAIGTLEAQKIIDDAVPLLENSPANGPHALFPKD